MSEQESYIHSMSQVLLGGQALFRPEKYANGMKEPADLAWISGKCVVLMYMTSGKRDFDRKRIHNHNQMHGWIRRWKQGINLVGDVAGVRCTFRYEDVDHIIGLSIVGGDDVGCIYESDEVAKKVNKLAVCATVSDEVFTKISRRSVGIRDVLDVLSAIKEMGGRVDNERMLNFIDNRDRNYAEESRGEFKDVWSDLKDFEDAWHDTRGYLIAIKNQADTAHAAEFFSDLNIADAIWLSVAERSLARRIAKPGEHGPLIAGVRRRSGIYTLIALVGAHIGVIADSEAIQKVGHFDLLVASSLEFGPENPIRIWAIQPPGTQTERILTSQILKLRASTG